MSEVKNERERDREREVGLQCTRKKENVGSGTSSGKWRRRTSTAHNTGVRDVTREVAMPEGGTAWLAGGKERERERERESIG